MSSSPLRKNVLQLKLGTLHGQEDSGYTIDTQRVNLFFQVGGDLIDLVSLADDVYQMNYSVPLEVQNTLQATLVVQTPNKVK
jgi:hypothetical protein